MPALLLTITQARLARALDGVGTETDPEALKRTILLLKNHSKHQKKPDIGINQRYNPTTPGVLGTKVYCTHWMRTGECDFTQQGCMFLHAMPDLDTLELLGFRSYPRWFREMPRDYQISNSKDFQIEGLNIHRHQEQQGHQSRSAQMFSSNNNNNGNRYIPPRGPVNSTYQTPPPSNYRRGGRAPFVTTVYNSPPIIPQFNRAAISSPIGTFGQYQAPLPPLNSPHQHANILSRTASPAPSAINRYWKPLAPEPVYYHSSGGLQHVDSISYASSIGGMCSPPPSPVPVAMQRNSVVAECGEKKTVPEKTRACRKGGHGDGGGKGRSRPRKVRERTGGKGEKTAADAGESAGLSCSSSEDKGGVATKNDSGRGA